MSNPFHFPSSGDHEELFGYRKFGADWVGPQTEVDLKLLADFHPPDQYFAGRLSESDLAEVHALTRASPDEWEFGGPAARRDEALAAHARAFKRKWQLIWVKEALRLIDKYGPQPKNGSADFEHLDPGDDRERLREARRLFAEQSTLENDLDGRDLTGAGGTTESAVVPATGLNIVPLKPAAQVAKLGKAGAKPLTRERIARQMLEELRSGKITEDRLRKMSNPALERTYKAHRDTCKAAREIALAEFQSRQLAPITE